MEGRLFYSKSIDLIVNLIKNTFPEAPRIVFDQRSGYCDIVKLTHKINHHNKSILKYGIWYIEENVYKSVYMYIYTVDPWITQWLEVPTACLKSTYHFIVSLCICGSTSMDSTKPRIVQYYDSIYF